MYFHHWRPNVRSSFHRRSSEISKWARREEKKNVIGNEWKYSGTFYIPAWIRRILKRVSKLDKQYGPSLPVRDSERYWTGGEIVAQSCSRQVGRGTIMIDDKNRDVYEYIALFACQWVMVERSIVPHDWYDARPQHARHEPPRVQMRATRYFYAFSDPFIDPLAVLFLHHYHQREIFRSRAKSNDKKRSKIASRNSKRKFERSSFQLRDSRMYE